jgi:ATP-dependent Clp protease ATP-binding subunit ClpX
MIEIDTSNILFIAGGAFVGLDAILKSRLRGSSIGFNTAISRDIAVDLAEVTPDDLVKFGLIPEFIGRFPAVVSLKELDRADLELILTSVKNNYIDQYRWLFQQDQVDFDLTQEARGVLIDRAISTGTGARALHSELERVLMPHMFDLVRYREDDIKTVTIIPELVNNPAPLERKNLETKRKISTGS